MKHILTLFFALSAVAHALAGNVYGLGGAGTATDPYQIASAEDFRAMADKISADNTAMGEYFVLVADIDFGGSAESPAQLPSIGKAAITSVSAVAWGFEGVFDGANHSISGIYHTDCSNDGNGKFNALFSSLGANGVVRNLVFAEGNYVKSYNYVAAFVSINKGGLIENCVNHADINAVNFAAAGICGYIAGGSGVVRNCFNNGNIVAMSYASGIVTGSQSGKSVGVSDADYVGVVISSCVNNGNISTTNGVGSAGIAGSFSGVVVNCTNNGIIDDSMGSATIQYTGGIVSCMTYMAEVRGNVNNGDVKGADYVGGIIGCVFKGSDESVEMVDNVNVGNVVGIGSNVGEQFGGSKRSQPISVAMVTGLHESNVNKDASEAEVFYNLMGQPVGKNAKGVVISKGKKILNR